MKKLLVLTSALMLSGLLATAVLANGNGNDMAQKEAPAARPEQSLDKGPVPQDQLELMNKREEAKKRRDEALKIRQQNIKAANQGALQVDPLSTEGR